MQICSNTMVFCSLFFFLLQIAEVRAPTPIHCVWGDWSSWSACDPCTKTQTQIRPILVYPQFGGNPCYSPSVRTQQCETTQSCPLQEGCGGRFRCQSGLCVSMRLLCDGDQDCEDGSDEWRCDSKTVCDLQRPPPHIQLTSLGYDVTLKSFRGSVINTQSFGGQCRKTFSGDHQNFYRLPQSMLSYTPQVSATNDFSSELYESSWHYMKKIENRYTTTGTTSGHDYFTSTEELKKSESKQMVMINSDVEVARVQNQPPQYLPLSEDFWKHLLSLPVVYDYPAYRQLLERFGTHYVTEATLGGQFRLLLHFSRDFIESLKKQVRNFHECVRKTHTLFFFIRWTTEKCRSDFKEIRNYFMNNKEQKNIQTRTFGGHTAYISKLNAIALNAEENGKTFSMWAGSVKDFPSVISHKVLPLYHLVKEVSCAEVKKLHLKRATEAYLGERDSCRCKPCRNNGLVMLKDGVCSCVCKAGTEGLECEHGSPLDEQKGVIHGSWSCWSEWSICSGGQRSRTRTCTHPAPQNGKYCNGNAEETRSCDNEEQLQYLQMMQPHCFDISLEPTKSCKSPPVLINGFILDPKDFYTVGSKIEYSCIDGYHLNGNAVAECTKDQTWKMFPMECKRSTCDTPVLPQDVMGSPWKDNYRIGESVLLNCSEGRQIIGPREISCNSALSWSPEPKTAKCTAAATVPPDELQCQPWQNRVQNQCVCKVPYQCEPSLEVCVTERSRSHRMSVCKIRAQQCLGRQFAVVENSACQLPDTSTAVCPQCSLWTVCDEQTQTCSCRALDECTPSSRWINICARLGEDAPVSTVTECEVGVRRCRGEKPQVIKAEPCEK